MGSILGFAIAFLAYALIYKLSGSAAVQQKIYLFMLLPPILGYALLPFGAGIWEKIYYKSYELGNNGFYIPSMTESEEEDEAESAANPGDDVNVEN
jgi:hypothetical protein